MTIICSHMDEYPKEEWNFIYNRFDLRYKEAPSCFLVELEEYSANRRYIIPYHIENNTILLGLWLNDIPNDVFYEVCKFCFSTFPYIKKIIYKNRPQVPEKRIARNNSDQCILGNHWKIKLPSSMQELLARVSSKTRYNIRRECRIAEEQLGGIHYEHYFASQLDETIYKVILAYFSYKYNTHGTDYCMTPEEYIQKYYVTDIYVLYHENNIGAILFSCEQTEIVYLENLTYNPALSSYSLGAILYNHFLGEIIAKKKQVLILGAGHQHYKSLYGGIEQTVCSGTLYRDKKEYWKSEIRRFSGCAIGYIRRHL